MVAALRGLRRLAQCSRFQSNLRICAIGRGRVFSTTTTFMRKPTSDKLGLKGKEELAEVDDLLRRQLGQWKHEEEDDEDLEELEKEYGHLFEDGDLAALDEDDDEEYEDGEEDGSDDWDEDDEDDEDEEGEDDEDEDELEEKLLKSVEQTPEGGWADDSVERGVEEYYGEDPPPSRRQKLKPTFLNLGEDEPWEEEGMLPDDEDDMPTMGHVELEQHREMRHYARLAAWEMPLLYKLATPFVPPTKDLPLRFRYTTYMGEQHPAEKKVVVEFCPQDLPDLTDVQRDKLKKLAGVRYNAQNDIVKMSCEMFDSQAQNKRYLGDTIEALLKEARTGDSFEDVPLRRGKWVIKPKFPMEWAMTEKRQKDLEKFRQELDMKDQQLALEGQVVDGLHQIKEGLVKREATIKAIPEMVMANQGRGKRLGVKRR